MCRKLRNWSDLHTMGWSLVRGLKSRWSVKKRTQINMIWNKTNTYLSWGGAWGGEHWECIECIDHRGNHKKGLKHHSGIPAWPNPVTQSLIHKGTWNSACADFLHGWLLITSLLSHCLLYERDFNSRSTLSLFIIWKGWLWQWSWGLAHKEFF